MILGPKKLLQLVKTKKLVENLEVLSLHLTQRDFPHLSFRFRPRRSKSGCSDITVHRFGIYLPVRFKANITQRGLHARSLSKSDLPGGNAILQQHD